MLSGSMSFNLLAIHFLDDIHNFTYNSGSKSWTVNFKFPF